MMFMGFAANNEYQYGQAGFVVGRPLGTLSQSSVIHHLNHKWLLLDDIQIPNLRG